MSSINTLRKKNIAFLRRELSKRKNISLINKLLESKYTYLFDWMGIRIIQYPSDILVFQELINNYKPQVIVETGIAHGGSLIFYSSMLKMIGVKNPKIIGVDINIKKNNLQKLKKNSYFKYIKLFKGSSTDTVIFNKIKTFCKNKKVLVFLDSNHTHDHVLNELILYSQLIKKNGYIIVLDTTLEFTKNKFINKNRDFMRGNSPHTAVKSFLKKNKKFIINNYFDSKAVVTSAIDGFLKKIL